MEKLLTLEPLIAEGCRLENVQLGKFTEVGILNFWENVSFDDYSYTGQFCFIQNANVGKFANIAAMVRIGPTDHPMDRPTLHHFTYRRRMYGFDEVDDIAFLAARKERKTVISHDTWIGHGAIIKPGVHIGNGAVVASGAVVTKDVAPYAIVAGVPAKEIRKRFDAETVARLEAIAWWDWPHDKLQLYFKDFLMDINTFVEKHYGK